MKSCSFLKFLLRYVYWRTEDGRCASRCGSGGRVFVNWTPGENILVLAAYDYDFCFFVFFGFAGLYFERDLL
jgi:hypothetical protein